MNINFWIMYIYVYKGGGVIVHSTFIHVYLCVSVRMRVYEWIIGQNTMLDSFGAAVRGTCKLPGLGAGNHIRFFCKHC